MIDSEQLMESIYEEANKELIKFGVRQLLTQMGFKVDEFSNKILLSVDNHQKAYELFNKEDLKKINEKLRRKISYHLDKNLVQILEGEVVANAVAVLQKEIVEQTELHLAMNVRTKIFKAYSDRMEKELTDKVMQDPKIRSLLLKDM